MTDEQTTLSEFASDSAGRDDVPTPESNAEDISRLADLIEEINGQVGKLAGSVDELEEPSSIERKPTDDTRMFQ